MRYISLNQLLLALIAILFIILPRPSFGSEPTKYIKATCWSIQLGERLCILGTDDTIAIVEVFGKRVEVSDSYFIAGAIEVDGELHIILQLKEQ